MEMLNEENKLTQKEKYRMYYDNNKDKFKSYTQCSICSGRYAYSRKNQHMKTTLHKFAEMKKANEEHERNSRIINEIQNKLYEFKSNCV